MPRPFDRTDFDRATCSSCGDEQHTHAPVYLHARCHVHARVRVTYSDGICSTRCGVCGEPIVDVRTDAPDAEIPDEPLEVFYLDGILRIGEAVTARVAGGLQA